MKKTLPLLFLLALTIAALCAACGDKEKEEEAAVDETAANLEEIALPRWATITADPAAVTVDGFSVEAADGTWSDLIHLCTDAEDLERYQGYYDGALTGDSYSEAVSGEKTLGDYTYQTADCVAAANGQFFSFYFTAFEEPVDFGDGNACWGLYHYVWRADGGEETKSAVESVIAGLKLTN